ncbi:MAG: nucleotide exchange factor GrpE [Anaerolineae bacterium]|nr:nucleotide exchange factor GrpE [Anaerolineae bacterium]
MSKEQDITEELVSEGETSEEAATAADAGTDAEAATEAGADVEAPAAEATPSLEALEAQLAEAEAKAAEYLDGWQRERAELANYRKRVERERAEMYLNAKLEMAGRLFPVLDDFERAADNIPEDARETEWANGIMLIYRKLQSILEAEGIVEIEALGQPFDPAFHEAISQDEDDAYEADHVIDVLQKGYRHGDRVLRPAMVRVAR